MPQIGGTFLRHCRKVCERKPLLTVLSKAVLGWETCPVWGKPAPHGAVHRETLPHVRCPLHRNQRQCGHGQHRERRVDAVQNLLNEWFVRDAIRKIRAVKRARAERGERSQPDRQNAETGTGAVSHSLFGTTHVSLDLDNPYGWSDSTITDMLENKLYPDNTINMKYSSKSYKDKRKVEYPREERLVFENTYPALGGKGGIGHCPAGGAEAGEGAGRHTEEGRRAGGYHQEVVQGLRVGQPASGQFQSAGRQLHGGAGGPESGYPVEGGRHPSLEREGIRYRQFHSQSQAIHGYHGTDTGAVPKPGYDGVLLKSHGGRPAGIYLRYFSENNEAGDLERG